MWPGGARGARADSALREVRQVEPAAGRSDGLPRRVCLPSDRSLSVRLQSERRAARVRASRPRGRCAACPFPGVHAVP